MPLYNPQVYGAIQTTKIASELTELQYKKQKNKSILKSPICITMHKFASSIAFIDSNLIECRTTSKKYAIAQ
jgi:hypothetical protein